MHRSESIHTTKTCAISTLNFRLAKRAKNDQKQTKKIIRVWRIRKNGAFRRKECEKENAPRVVIEHVADLDVHGPIGPYEHVARSAFHHGIHHFLSPLRFETWRDRRFSDDHKPTNGAIGERFWHRTLLFLYSKKRRLKRVWWILLQTERFGMGLEWEVWSLNRGKRNISIGLMRRCHVSMKVRLPPDAISFATTFESTFCTSCCEVHPTIQWTIKNVLHLKNKS